MFELSKIVKQIYTRPSQQSLIYQSTCTVHVLYMLPRNQVGASVNLQLLQNTGRQGVILISNKQQTIVPLCLNLLNQEVAGTEFSFQKLNDRKCRMKISIFLVFSKKSILDGPGV